MTPRRLLSAAAGVAAVLACALMADVVAQTVDRDGWRLASPGRAWRFPADHGSHPAYRIEWWYYVGNVEAPSGRRFGYQLTFFRTGVDPMPENPSRWAIRDLYMAHLAVTDVATGRHLVAERLNRAGVGWAGASTDRLAVWNDDWTATMVDGDRQVLSARADSGAFGIDLTLTPSRPLVRHGVGGFSRKGDEAGNASYYYSFTRLATTGRVMIDGVPIDVQGTSWMDHEFGTSFLEAGEQGWDWFALQLEDGTDLMLYELRREDGSPHGRSSGTLVRPDGSTVHLASDDYRLTPGRTWTSRESGARYPVSWHVEVPREGLSLDVSAVLDGQELDTPESTGVTYWEGAVDVTGTRVGAAASGRGYLEMTGYAGRPMSEVLR